MLSVMGRKGTSSITIGEVGLVTVSGTEAVSNGSTTDMGNGDILVTVDAVPEGEFVVILKGTDKESNSEFQRQSTTQMSVSTVNIQVSLFTYLSDSMHLFVFVLFIIKNTYWIIITLEDVELSKSKTTYSSLPLFSCRLWWTAVWSQGKPLSSLSVSWPRALVVNTSSVPEMTETSPCPTQTGEGRQLKAILCFKISNALINGKMYRKPQL